MKLSIYKEDGRSYSHKCENLPFIYEVEFEDEFIIGDDLRANLFLLKHNTNEMIQVGGSACITSIRKGEEKVSPVKNKRLHVNVLEDEEDIGVLIPGNYTLFGGVIGFVKSESGFKPFELKSEIQVVIK